MDLAHTTDTSPDDTMAGGAGSNTSPHGDADSTDSPHGDADSTDSPHGSTDVDAAAQLVRLAAAGCLSRVLAAAARLGVADLVAEGPLTSTELATRTGCDPAMLDHLLHTLATTGVVRRTDDGAFALTAVGAPLRSSHPYSVRNMCILTAETYDDAFGGLYETLRTGAAGFDAVFGVPLYTHLDQDEHAGRVFDAAMAELAVPTVEALSRVHDFAAVRTVVDVGGGDGTTLAILTARHPALRGVCVDRAQVCERARSGPAAHRAGERLVFRPGDIFTRVPDGGDRYLLKNVLHDWSPEQCGRILATVAAAMRRTVAASGGAPGQPPRLLVVEPVSADGHDVPPEGDDAAHVLFQTVVCGRDAGGLSQSALLGLLEQAGFTVSSVLPLAGEHRLFDCVLADSHG